MGTKPKIRITVTVDGVDSELFSIRQRNHGEIVLVKKAANAFDAPIVSSAVLKEERYSLHPSHQSKDPNAVTLKYTATTEDGATYDSAAFVSLAEPDDLWPLAAVRTQNLSLDRYRLKRKPRDRHVNLGSYASARATFVYLMLIGRSDGEFEALQTAPLPSHVIKFESFSMILLSGYINVPSIPSASSFMQSTGLPRINRNSAPNMQIEGIPTKVADLTALVDDSAGRFSKSYVEAVAWLHQCEGAKMEFDAAQMAALASVITAEPLIE